LFLEEGFPVIQKSFPAPSLRSAFKLARALGVDRTAFQTDDAGPAKAAPAKKGKKRKGGS
jgi:hypothetical protein